MGRWVCPLFLLFTVVAALMLPVAGAEAHLDISHSDRIAGEGTQTFIVEISNLGYETADVESISVVLYFRQGPLVTDLGSHMGAVEPGETRRFSGEVFIPSGEEGACDITVYVTLSGMSSNDGSVVEHSGSVTIGSARGSNVEAALILVIGLAVTGLVLYLIRAPAPPEGPPDTVTGLGRMPCPRCGVMMRIDASRCPHCRKRL